MTRYVLVCAWCLSAPFVILFTAAVRHGHPTAAVAATSAIVPAAADSDRLAALPAEARGDATRHRNRPAFGYRVTAGGGRQLYVVRPDLQFTNTRYLDGRAVIVLAADDDRVEIALSERDGRVRVSRSGKEVAYFPRAANEPALDRARAALAGSKAVRRFRMLASDDEDDDPKHPGVAGLQIADAIVGVLEGDLGAPMRLARRLENHQSAAAVRRVTTSQEECLIEYMAEAINAYGELASCAEDLGWDSAVCAFDWAIRVENAWAQFVSCVQALLSQD